MATTDTLQVWNLSLAVPSGNIEKTASMLIGELRDRVPELCPTQQTELGGRVAGISVSELLASVQADGCVNLSSESGAFGWTLDGTMSPTVRIIARISFDAFSPDSVQRAFDSALAAMGTNSGGRVLTPSLASFFSDNTFSGAPQTFDGPPLLFRNPGRRIQTTEEAIRPNRFGWLNHWSTGTVSQCDVRRRLEDSGLAGTVRKTWHADGSLTFRVSDEATDISNAICRATILGLIHLFPEIGWRLEPENRRKLRSAELAPPTTHEFDSTESESE